MLPNPLRSIVRESSVAALHKVMRKVTTRLQRVGCNIVGILQLIVMRRTSKNFRHGTDEAVDHMCV